MATLKKMAKKMAKRNKASELRDGIVSNVEQFEKVVDAFINWYKCITTEALLVNLPFNLNSEEQAQAFGRIMVAADWEKACEIYTMWTGKVA